jgi:hypothetical protein
MAIVTPDGDVRSEMINWIRKNYGEMLGKDADNLDKPGGLDAVQQKYCADFTSRLRKAA